MRLYLPSREHAEWRDWAQYHDGGSPEYEVPPMVKARQFLLPPQPVDDSLRGSELPGQLRWRWLPTFPPWCRACPLLEPAMAKAKGVVCV